MIKYEKAPIIEALIDIQVSAPHALTIADLEKVQESEMARYPNKNRVFHASISTNVKEGEGFTTETTKSQPGWVFRSGDTLQAFQARLGGFAFSRLAPYESWAPFRDEARRLWNAYRAVASPAFVTRIAVRYINRLDLPLPFGDFREFLKAAPEIPAGLPQGLAGFFFQALIPQVDLSAMLMLSEGLVPSPKAEHASVILDLDLFRDKDLPTDEDAIWELFEQFRAKKDEVFEACITDKMRELIC